MKSDNLRHVVKLHQDRLNTAVDRDFSSSISKEAAYGGTNHKSHTFLSSNLNAGTYRQP